MYVPIFKKTLAERVKLQITSDICTSSFETRVFTALGAFARLETHPPVPSSKTGRRNRFARIARVDTISRGVLSLLISQPFKQPAGRNSRTDRGAGRKHEGNQADSNSCHISRTQLIARSKQNLGAAAGREIDLAPSRLFSLFPLFSRDISRNYYFIRTAARQLTTRPRALQNNPERREIDFSREYSYSLLFLETSREIIFFFYHRQSRARTVRLDDARRRHRAR